MPAGIQKNRLSRDEIRRLIKLVPKPSGIYKIKEATFELYEAKKINTKHWTNKALRRLLVDARGSYNIYGRRPRLDPYDAKASIYLARARFNWPQGNSHPKIPVELWFSNRFVPNAGKPRGAAELDICSYGRRSVESVVHNQVFRGRRNFLNFILSYSRMCNIAPYTVRKSDEAPLKRMPLLKNPFSAICFSLTCKQFIRDYADDFHYQYITGLIRDDLVEHALTLWRNGVPHHPIFTPAYRFLHATKKDIVLNRGVYTYEFPGYFLMMPALLHLLRGLAAKGRLTGKTFTHYLGSPDIIHCTNDFRKLGALGRLLAAKGKIFGTNLTGKELRRLVDKNVPDRAELKIDRVDRWKKSIDDVLWAGGVKQVV